MQTEVIKQQLDTYPPIRSSENSMKYQMPEPAIQTTAFSRDHSTQGYYTAKQVQAAFDAGRAAGLEAAAKVCEDDWNGDADTYQDSIAFNVCADAIRNLAKETPCLDGTTDSAKTTAVNSDAGLQKDLAQGNNLGDKT